MGEIAGLENPILKLSNHLKQNQNRNIAPVDASVKTNKSFASELFVTNGETLEMSSDKWPLPDEKSGILQESSSTELFLSSITCDLVQTLESIETELDKTLKTLDIQVNGVHSLIELVDSAKPRIGGLLIKGKIEAEERLASVSKLLEEAKKRSLNLKNLKRELEITIKTPY